MKKKIFQTDLKTEISRQEANSFLSNEIFIEDQIDTESDDKDILNYPFTNVSKNYLTSPLDDSNEDSII